MRISTKPNLTPYSKTFITWNLRNVVLEDGSMEFSHGVTNHNGAIIAQFIGVTKFEDGVDDVKGLRGGEAKVDDVVEKSK